MTLQEFINKGYKINAQVKVVETREINLSKFARHNDIDDCQGDVVDTWYDDSAKNDLPVSYDIIDSDGELLSGYEPTLFSNKDVMNFIAKL